MCPGAREVSCSARGTLSFDLDREHPGPENSAVPTDPAVLEEHLGRIRDGLTSDPAAAISSSKNLLESLFRIVLDRSQIDYGAREDIPQLAAGSPLLLWVNMADNAFTSLTARNARRA